MTSFLKVKEIEISDDKVKISLIKQSNHFSDLVNKNRKSTDQAFCTEEDGEKKDLIAQDHYGGKTYNCSEFSAFLKSVLLTRSDSPAAKTYEGAVREQIFPSNVTDDSNLGKKIDCIINSKPFKASFQSEINYVYDLSSEYDLKTDCDFLGIMLKSAIVTISGETEEG